VDILKLQKAVSSKTNGATPLVIASKNGHLKVVQFLISDLKADVEQVSDHSMHMSEKGD
jgi:ankyrin repeat protein